MQGKKPTPKYKQALPKGLTPAQIKTALLRRVKTAQSVVKRHAQKKGARGGRLGVKTKRWIEADNRTLNEIMIKNKIPENREVAEKLLRVRFEIMEHYDIPDEHMATFDAILERLKKAKNSKVVLDQKQTILLDSYFSRI